MQDNNNNNDGFLNRLKKATVYALTGVTKDTFMSPGLPPTAIAQDASRQFDYQMSTNMTPKPKGNAQITFNQLRFLADNMPILRTVISTRKNQVTRMRWKFQSKDKTKPASDINIKKLTDFFEKPDREHTFSEWVKALLEDMYVIDAPCLEPVLDALNRPYSFDLVDGSTITRVLNNRGRTPIDGISIAYQQVLKGMPTSSYTYEELIYKPSNIRTHKVYGLSIVEQIVQTINLSIQKSISDSSYYSDGNTPNLILSTPEDWSPQDIKKFQLYWDELNTGVNKNTAKFVPEGVKPFSTKGDTVTTGMDEWLARIVCFAFAISPQALSPHMNRATAETAQESANNEGLYPTLEWIRNLVNDLVVRYFKLDDIEFVWDYDEDTSPEVKANITKIYFDMGALTVDEVRDGLGREPFTPEQLAQLEALKPVISNDVNSGDGAPFQTKMDRIKKKREFYQVKKM